MYWQKSSRKKILEQTKQFNTEHNEQLKHFLISNDNTKEQYFNFEQDEPILGAISSVASTLLAAIWCKSLKWCGAFICPNPEYYRPLHSCILYTLSI